MFDMNKKDGVYRKVGCVTVFQCSLNCELVPWRVFLNMVISSLGKENPEDHPTRAAERFSANCRGYLFQLAGYIMHTANTNLDEN